MKVLSIKYVYVKSKILSKTKILNWLMRHVNISRQLPFEVYNIFLWRNVEYIIIVIINMHSSGYNNIQCNVLSSRDLQKLNTEVNTNLID